MPFKSEAQRRWMYANEPEMAERWEKETSKGKKLPDRLKKKKKRRKKTAASKKQVHQLAEKLKIPWDDDPKFMRWTEKLTGKSCLDAMDKGELAKVYKALLRRGKTKTAEAAKSAYAMATGHSASAKVKAHDRKMPDGSVVRVEEHTRKRTKRKKEPAHGRKIPRGVFTSKYVVKQPYAYEWTNPYTGKKVTHKGIDVIPAGNNITVHSPIAGKVVSRGYEKGGLGHYIWISNDKTNLLLAHLAGPSPLKNYVRTGDVVGDMGSTGGVTGPHLHIEERVDINDPMTTVDPSRWLRSAKVEDPVRRAALKKRGKEKTAGTEEDVAIALAKGTGQAYVTKRFLDRGLEQSLGVQRFVHGTSRDAAKKILKAGLLTERGGKAGGAAASLPTWKKVFTRAKSKKYVHVADDRLMGRRYGSGAHGNLVEMTSQANKKGLKLTNAQGKKAFWDGLTFRNKGAVIGGALPYKKYHKMFKVDTDLDPMTFYKPWARKTLSDIPAKHLTKGRAGTAQILKATKPGELLGHMKANPKRFGMGLAFLTGAGYLGNAAFKNFKKAVGKEKTASVKYKLLLEGNRDPSIKGYVHPRKKRGQHVPILHKGKTVGFFTPRKDKSGYYRTGAIYITPKHRGKGIASKAIRNYLKGKKGKAFVEMDNKASRRAFLAAGFKQGEQGHKGNWFYKVAARTFTHNDKTYDVEKLWKIDKPPKKVFPDKILKSTGRTWGHGDKKYGWKAVLDNPKKYPKETKAIRDADLKYPILLRKGVVVDGIHRLVKARQTGEPVHAISLSKKDMEGALRVKAHTRRTASGKITQVEEHTRKGKKKEFAPGIPDRKRFVPIPSKPGEWEYVIQDHHAHRAGKHFDLRLGEGNNAHSWALRYLPEPGKMVLAIQQPTHTTKYMDFTGTIPEGYGAGEVKQLDRGRVEVLESNNNKVIFNKYEGKKANEYVLIRTKENKWLLYNRTTFEGKYEYPRLKNKYRSIKYDDTLALKPGVMQPKVDGAHSLVVLEANKRPRVFSYRTSKRGDVLEYTHKIPGFFKNKVPGDLSKIGLGRKIVLRAETYMSDTSGKALPSERTAAVLNSGIERARDIQKGTGGLKLMIFDIVTKKPMSYNDKLAKIEQLSKAMPYLGKPDLAVTPKEKMEMVRKIRSKKHPLTSEGVVIWDDEGATKAKITDDADVYIKDVFEGEGKYKGKAAGGFSYSRVPDGPIVGKVGTGFSDAQRRYLWENREKLTGRVAKISYDKETSRGVFFAPRFRGWHLDKNVGDMPPHKRKALMLTPDMTPDEREKKLKQIRHFWKIKRAHTLTGTAKLHGYESVEEEFSKESGLLTGIGSLTFRAKTKKPKKLQVPKKLMFAQHAAHSPVFKKTASRGIFGWSLAPSTLKKGLKKDKALFGSLFGVPKKAAGAPKLVDPNKQPSIARSYVRANPAVKYASPLHKEAGKFQEALKRVKPSGPIEWPVFFGGMAAGGPIPGTSILALAGYRKAKTPAMKAVDFFTKGRTVTPPPDVARRLAEIDRMNALRNPRNVRMVNSRVARHSNVYNPEYLAKHGYSQFFELMMRAKERPRLRKLASKAIKGCSVMGHAKGSRYTRTGRSIVRPHKRLSRRLKKKLEKGKGV